MEREDVLEIEFIPVWDRWAWRITKQDEEVFPRDDFYDDALGVYCNGNPEFIKGRNDLFILSDQSDTKIGTNICDDDEKKMIEEKVRLINKKYGKSWRAEKSGGKDIVFCILLVYCVYIVAIHLYTFLYLFKIKNPRKH